jgi:ubiquinone/menaquinone biosynthesis C-methylase UbiE
MLKDEKDAKKMYHGLAEEYHSIRSKKKSFHNEYVEVPAMINMLGNLKNKKVLDWGCGSGLYIKRLKNKCKTIKGFDISPEMVKIANNLNPKIDIRVGSGTKIPFNEKFDVVFASLAIHYLKDLDKPFKEIKRVLNKGGIFIFSTGNPIAKAGKSIYVEGKKYKALGVRDFFKTDKVDLIHTLANGKKVKVFNYVIKTKQVIQLAQRHGFEIIDYEDTKPISGGKKVDPEHYAMYSKFPLFSIWKLMKK